LWAVGCCRGIDTQQIVHHIHSRKGTVLETPEQGLERLQLWGEHAAWRRNNSQCRLDDLKDTVVHGLDIRLQETEGYTEHTMLV
jgi:hypothetical protein